MKIIGSKPDIEYWGLGGLSTTPPLRHHHAAVLAAVLELGCRGYRAIVISRAKNGDIDHVAMSRITVGDDGNDDVYQFVFDFGGDFVEVTMRSLFSPLTDETAADFYATIEKMVAKDAEVKVVGLLL